MFVNEYGAGSVPLLEYEDYVDSDEMRQQAVAIFYGWGLAIYEN